MFRRHFTLYFLFFWLLDYPGTGLATTSTSTSLSTCIMYDLHTCTTYYFCHWPTPRAYTYSSLIAMPRVLLPLENRSKFVPAASWTSMGAVTFQ